VIILIIWARCCGFVRRRTVVFYELFGTSCSTPVFAAFVSLVNSARLLQNMDSIGFINPTLYQLGSNATFAAQHPNSSFNDVTSGYNKCCSSDYSSQAECCESGFFTNVGWDPVSGWGSIDYTSLANLFDVNVTYSAVTASSGSGSDNGLSPQASAGIAIAVIVVVLGGAYLVVTRVIRKPLPPQPAQQMYDENSVRSIPMAAAMVRSPMQTGTVTSVQLPPVQSTY
jgi:hypothetical protein